MQPDELIRKRAKKVVDAGSVTLAQLQESIATNEKLDQLLSQEKIEIPEFPTEISVSNLPEYPSEISVSNLPEVQKVEVLNFPKQDAPVVNISPTSPIVNVDAPIVDVHQEEVVAELQNIAGLLSQEEGIDKTEIVDTEGNPVNCKELFDKLGNKIGNIKTVVSGGGGGLNQDQLRATLLTTQSQNYATQIDDVSTTSVTYIGKAGVGSSTSSAVWQIQKVDESGSPITSVITWADGNANFDNVWTNRTSLTYN